MALPSTVTVSFSPTSRAGSVTTLPLTWMRPAHTRPSEALRDATPLEARNFARRIACHHSGVDFTLLEQRLAELDEPAYRARQIWKWTAQGAGVFSDMSDLPLRLRSALDATV